MHSLQKKYAHFNVDSDTGVLKEVAHLFEAKPISGITFFDGQWASAQDCARVA